MIWFGLSTEREGGTAYLYTQRMVVIMVDTERLSDVIIKHGREKRSST